MSRPDLSRRRLTGMAAASAGLAVLPWGLSGCATRQELFLPTGHPADPEARALLQRAAEAHGLAAWARVRDLSVSYSGRWRPLVDRLQPDLVDARFRGTSEERVNLAEGWAAQWHSGLGGIKQVLRRGGRAARSGAAPRAATGNASIDTIEVHYNGQPEEKKSRLDAAALVVDGYLLFLLGPLALVQDPTLNVVAAPAGQVDGRDCDVVQVNLTPGLGRSAADQLQIFIDRRDHLMRRVRFSLEGMESTRSAVAEVDTFDHIERHGVQWPTRFHERLLRPVPKLAVHDWWLTGLDINRGLSVPDISGQEWSPKAKRPAAPLA